MKRWMGAASLSLLASASVLATDLPVQKPDYHVTTKMEFITSYIWANVPPGVPLPHETESADKAANDVGKQYDDRLKEISERFDDSNGMMDEVYAMKALV